MGFSFSLAKEGKMCSDSDRRSPSLLIGWAGHCGERDFVSLTGLAGPTRLEQPSHLFCCSTSPQAIYTTHPIAGLVATGSNEPRCVAKEQGEALRFFSTYPFGKSYGCPPTSLTTTGVLLNVGRNYPLVGLASFPFKDQMWINRNSKDPVLLF